MALLTLFDSDFLVIALLASGGRNLAEAMIKPHLGAGAAGRS